MRKSFSFVFMGVLGFAAAVTASSFSPSTILNLKNGFDIGQVEDGVGSKGFKFSGNGAHFVETGGGNIAVAVTTTIGPFDNIEKFHGLTAESKGPLSLEIPSLELSPFFSIEADAFEAFEFISAKLGGNAFDFAGEGAIIRAFGKKANAGYFVSSLSSVFPAGTVGASAFGLEGTPLESLGFSLGSGTSAAFAKQSDETQDIVSLLIDDVEVSNIAPVPVPASALLLGTALLGAGFFARRKKRG